MTTCSRIHSYALGLDKMHLRAYNRVRNYFLDGILDSSTREIKWVTNQ